MFTLLNLFDWWYTLGLPNCSCFVLPMIDGRNNNFWILVLCSMIFFLIHVQWLFILVAHSLYPPKVQNSKVVNSASPALHKCWVRNSPSFFFVGPFFSRHSMLDFFRDDFQGVPLDLAIANAHGEHHPLQTLHSAARIGHVRWSLHC